MKPQQSDQSLRSILAGFEKKGWIHHVNAPVDPIYELAAVMLLKGRGPALFFHDVKRYRMPVIGNLFNSYKKIAAAMNIGEDRLQDELIEAVSHGIKPEIISEGPVQEVVAVEPLDLPTYLPVPTWFEKERGPYITAGVIFAKDIETGARNVSIARLCLEGDNALLAGIAPTHHLHRLMSKAENHGHTLEIAVAVGNHIAVLLASQMYVDLGHDECEIAGRLLGEPLRLVRCKTVDLEVPAEAELVLEGRLDGSQRLEEGPVSEFHGFYEYYGPGNKAEVTAITHRKDAMYQAICPGYAPEHLLLGGAAIGATTCRALKKSIPSVRRVQITEGGMGRVHAIVTMNRPKPGEGKRAILLAMGHTNLLKLVIVVDDDIDPADWRQVEWAMAAHMRAEEDILILPGVKADRCDPQERGLTVTKVGIVATRRRGEGESDKIFVHAHPPAHVLEEVRQNLNRY